MYSGGRAQTKNKLLTHCFGDENGFSLFCESNDRNVQFDLSIYRLQEESTIFKCKKITKIDEVVLNCDISIDFEKENFIVGDLNDLDFKIYLNLFILTASKTIQSFDIILSPTSLEVCLSYKYDKFNVNSFWLLSEKKFIYKDAMENYFLGFWNQNKSIEIKFPQKESVAIIKLVDLKKLKRSKGMIESESFEPSLHIFITCHSRNLYHVQLPLLDLSLINFESIYLQPALFNTYSSSIDDIYLHLYNQQNYFIVILSSGQLVGHPLSSYNSKFFSGSFLDGKIPFYSQIKLLFPVEYGLFCLYYDRWVIYLWNLDEFEKANYIQLVPLSSIDLPRFNSLIRLAAIKVEKSSSSTQNYVQSINDYIKSTLVYSVVFLSPYNNDYYHEVYLSNIDNILEIYRSKALNRNNQSIDNDFSLNKQYIYLKTEINSLKNDILTRELEIMRRYLLIRFLYSKIDTTSTIESQHNNSIKYFLRWDELLTISGYYRQSLSSYSLERAPSYFSEFVLKISANDEQIFHLIEGYSVLIELKNSLCSLARSRFKSTSLSFKLGFKQNHESGRFECIFPIKLSVDFSTWILANLKISLIFPLGSLGCLNEVKISAKKNDKNQLNFITIPVAEIVPCRQDEMLDFAKNTRALLNFQKELVYRPQSFFSLKLNDSHFTSLSFPLMLEPKKLNSTVSKDWNRKVFGWLSKFATVQNSQTVKPSYPLFWNTKHQELKINLIKSSHPQRIANAIRQETPSIGLQISGSSGPLNYLLVIVTKAQYLHLLSKYINTAGLNDFLDQIHSGLYDLEDLDDFLHNDLLLCDEIILKIRQFKNVGVQQANASTKRLKDLEDIENILVGVYKDIHSV